MSARCVTAWHQQTMAAGVRLPLAIREKFVYRYLVGGGWVVVARSLPLAVAVTEAEAAVLPLST